MPCSNYSSAARQGIALHKENAAMATITRSPILYPTHINLYLQCPERYYHERIERRRADQVFSPALAKGIAIHEILASLAAAYQHAMDHGDGPAVPIDLVCRAEAALPRARYGSELAWRADVEAVVGAAKNGVSYLDGEARVLATEATYQFPYLQGKDCPPFTLAAKVDLVLHRRDANGQWYLDVVDYKGGTSVRVDPIQELAARIVVKQKAHRFNVDYAYIQSTTLFVGVGVINSDVLSTEECGNRWSQMKQAVAGMLGGHTWRPNPSPLCEWCPYFNKGCSLTPELGVAEDIATWLDGAAD